MKCFTKRKGFSRSGSDSGVSCDGSRSPVSLNSYVELSTAFEENMNTPNKYLEIKDEELVGPADLDQGKLISYDNSDFCKKRTRSTSKTPTKNSETELKFKISPFKPSKGENATTVTKKCVIDEKWNKFMLGKAKVSSPDGKSAVLGEKVLSVCIENIHNADSAIGKTKIFEKNNLNPCPSKINKARTKKGRTVNNAQQRIDISNTATSSDDRINKLETPIKSESNLTTTQDDIVKNKLSVSLLTVKCDSSKPSESCKNARVSEDKSKNSSSIRKLKSSGNGASKVYRKRKFSEENKAKSFENDCTQEVIEKMKKTSNIHQNQDQGTSLFKKNQSKIKFNFRKIRKSKSKICDKTAEIHSQANEKLAKNTEILVSQPVTNTKEILPVSQTNRKRKRKLNNSSSTVVSRDQLQETTETSMEKSNVNENTIDAESDKKTVEAIRNRYSVLHHFDYNKLPILTLEKLTQVPKEACFENTVKRSNSAGEKSKSDILHSNQIKTMVKSSHSAGEKSNSKILHSNQIKSMVESSNSAGEKSSSEILHSNQIKSESISPSRSPDSITLRDVRVVLEDIGAEKNNRKIIKLNRNWTLSKLESRSKPGFRYKLNNDLTPVTSRNNIFCGSQLTEGFTFKSPLQSPLIFEEISSSETFSDAECSFNYDSPKLKRLKVMKTIISPNSDKLSNENIVRQESYKTPNKDDEKNKVIPISFQNVNTEKINNVKITNTPLVKSFSSINLGEITPKNIKNSECENKFENVKFTENHYNLNIQKKRLEQERSPVKISPNVNNVTPADTQSKKPTSKVKSIKNIQVSSNDVTEKINKNSKDAKTTTSNQFSDSGTLSPSNKSLNNIHSPTKAATEKNQKSERSLTNSVINKNNKDINIKYENNEKDLFMEKHLKLYKGPNLKNMDKMKLNNEHKSSVNVEKDLTKMSKPLEGTVNLPVKVSEEKRPFAKSIDSECNGENKIKLTSSNSYLRPSDECITSKPHRNEIKNVENPVSQQFCTESEAVDSNYLLPKPRHIFKFEKSDVKRPPTRMPKKVILNRPTSSPEIFKVPVLPMISPSSNQKVSTKLESEADSISIYAETFCNESVLDNFSVRNDSDIDSNDEDENCSDLFILPEPTDSVKSTDVNEWVDNTVKICESQNQIINTSKTQEDTQKSSQLDKAELGSVFIDKTKNERIDEYAVDEDVCDADNIIIPSVMPPVVLNSNPVNPVNCTKAINLFDYTCHIFFKYGLCKKRYCRFKHSLPPGWEVKLKKLPVESCLSLYNYAKKKHFIYFYKEIFPVLAEYLGDKGDFTNLIRMVKDVIETDINSDRAPFINYVIDAFCKSGVTFHSIVEFVYKNANVSPDYINFLSDILLTLIIEKGDCDTNWIVIKELFLNKMYDVDIGIIRTVIVECLQKKPHKKELFFKVYHDLIKKIPNCKLSLVSECIVNNFYTALLKFNLTAEATEYSARCQAMNIILGNRSDHSNSPTSPAVTNSINSSPTVKVSPIQNRLANRLKHVSPLIISSNNYVPIKPQFPHTPVLNPVETFEAVPFETNDDYPSTSLIANNCNISPSLPQFEPNISSDYPSTSVLNNYCVPSPLSGIAHNMPVESYKTPRNAYPGRLRRTDVVPNTPYSPFKAPFRSSLPGLPSHMYEEMHNEVKKAFHYPNNHLEIYSLIIKYKDNLTDIFMKQMIEIMLKEKYEFKSFYENLWHFFKYSNSPEDDNLRNILKVIGLNIIIHLIKKSEWDEAFLVYKTLEENFSDINNVLNVTLYFKDKISYYKRILLIIEMHLKKGKLDKSWHLLKEHGFPCLPSSNNLEISFRNMLIDELLQLVVEKEFWRIGMDIVKYIIKTNTPDVDVKKYINDIFRQAINKNCDFNNLKEFVESSEHWYKYVDSNIYRAIVTQAVIQEDWKLAKQIYKIGRNFNTYPILTGSERQLCLPIFYVLEEVWLIFEIFFENMTRLYPIPHNIIIRIDDKTRTTPIHELPKNLHQFNVSHATMQARFANILSNFIKPPVTLLNQNKMLFLPAESVNKHLKIRISQLQEKRDA